MNKILKLWIIKYETLLNIDNIKCTLIYIDQYTSECNLIQVKEVSVKELWRNSLDW